MTLVCSRGIAVLVAALLLTAPAAAERAERDGRAPPPSIDQFTAGVINDAVELLNEEDYAGAREELGRLKLDRLSPYERSRVEQMLASIDSAQERYLDALEHLREALRAGGLNDQEQSQVTYTIAQLHAVQDQWAEASRTLEQWFQTAVSPNSAAYYLLALAYYQQDDHERALEPAQQAVNLAEKPQVSWLQLILALRLQREEYPQAADLLKRLIAADPGNKGYWVQLSSVYAQLEQYAQSLATLRVAHAAGLLNDPADLRRLADLLAMNEIPFGCAKVLGLAVAGQAGEAGAVADLDAGTWEKLANCWIAAGEFGEAVAPLERAAQLSEDGALFVRLGEVHVQLEDWAAAVEAIEQGIARGGLDDEAGAYVLAGIALFKQGELRPALARFGRAAGSERHGKLARGYIQLIESEVGEPLAVVEVKR